MTIYPIDFYYRLLARQKRHGLRNNSDPFATMTDKQFRKLFRFNKWMCRILINLIKPYLTPRKQPYGISREIKILCVLRFLATGLHGHKVMFYIF